MKNNTSFHYALFIIIVIIAALTFLSGQQVKNALFDEIKTDIQIKSAEVENILTSAYQQYRNDIEFVYELPQIKGLIRLNSDTGIDPVSNISEATLKSQTIDTFTSFLHKHPQYFQLRVLNAQGFEYIRVERSNGTVRTVPSNDLQDKSDRYYFTQTMSMQEDSLFVSYIDLNRENGQIVFPYQPTVRMAKPLYSNENVFYGEIILNIDVSYLLQEIKDIVHKHFDVVLLDYEKRFIQHPSKSLSFSRDLAVEQTFDTVYETVDAKQVNGLSTYKNTLSGSLFYGAGEKMTVAQSTNGGTLFSYLLASDKYFQEELNKRWWANFSILAIVLVLMVTSLLYLNKKNNELNRLLSVSEESKAAVDVAEEGVVTLDKNWNINTANSAFEHMFSLYNDNVIGKSFKQTLLHIGAVSTIKKLEANIDGKGSFRDQFHLNMGIEGERWFNIKVSTIQNKEAKAKYAVVFNNITSEKLASLALTQSHQELERKVEIRTAELQKARDKALEVSHLKSKFISTISHEMRTPLNGIVGATTLMKKEVLSPKLVQLIAMADNSVASLSELINDVLDLSKIEAGKLELNYSNFNPEALIEKIAEAMSTQTKKKGLGFYVDNSNLNFSSIYCDPLRLTQIINNLLSNANKFTDLGFIALTAWSEIKSDKGFIHIKVTDTGIGISPANQRKLFKAFSQADESIAERFGGTGLGLSICKELTSLLNGELSLESVQGKGSEFTVKLTLESWEIKREEDKHQLSGKFVGLMLSSHQIQQHIENTIVSHGGQCNPIISEIQQDELGQYDALFIDAMHPLKSKLKALWSQWDNNLTKRPVLIEISTNHLPHDERIEDSKALMLPIFRRELIESILNQGSVESPEAMPEGLSNDLNTGDSSAIETSTTVSISPTLMVSPSDSNTALSETTKLNLNVLIVDDNEINRQVAMYITEPHCDHVVMVENGVQALAALKDNTVTFDAILMDCNMPEMNGYQITHNIRLGEAGDFYRSVPIIAMTANALKGENEKCIAAGMNGYITKPVDADILIRALEDIAKNKPSTLRIANIDEQAAQEEEVEEVPLWDKNGMVDRLGGNNVLINKLLSLFINDYPDKKAKLKQALHDGNREDIRFYAHTIKGNLGDIGASKGRQFFEDIEQQALTADIPHLSALFVEAESIIKQTIALFNEELEHS